jgi:hypothetical protein
MREIETIEVRFHLGVHLLEEALHNGQGGALWTI